jgi:hypothetical protein
MGIRSVSSESVKPHDPRAAWLSPIRSYLLWIPEDQLTMPARQKIVKAVIPAAGFGTRMLPATKVLPKEMLSVAGEPLIQYAVEETAASGIETVILIIRNHKSLIQAHFARDCCLM